MQQNRRGGRIDAGVLTQIVGTKLDTGKTLAHAPTKSTVSCFAIPNIVIFEYIREMLLYEFHSPRWHIRALTSDAMGLCLPVDYAPWNAKNGGQPIKEINRKHSLYQIMERDGFFLISLGVRTKS